MPSLAVFLFSLPRCIVLFMFRCAMPSSAMFRYVYVLLPRAVVYNYVVLRFDVVYVYVCFVS